MKDETLLEVRNLSKAFYSRYGINLAVDNVSFRVARGEVLGLIGQSGSGKTTVANALVRLLKEVTGVVTLNGKVVSRNLYGRRKKQYNRAVQKIFQDPHTALNDKRNVFSTIAEPLVAHRVGYEWAFEYIKYDKLILQTFYYSLRETFLNAEVKLATLSTKLRLEAANEVGRNLRDFELTQFSNDEERANALSNLIASYYDPQLNAENRILSEQVKVYGELVEYYTNAKERIKKRDLAWDEADLVNAKEALSDYVISFNDRNINKTVRKLSREFRRETRSEKRETRELLGALIKERSQKRKFFYVNANLATTKEARAKILAQRERQKLELNGLKALRAAKLTVPNSQLFDLEAHLINLDSAALKDYFATQLSELKAVFAAWSQTRQKAHQQKLDAAFARKGEAVKPDVNVVAELTAKVAAAQVVFDEEAEKARIAFNERAAKLEKVLADTKMHQSKTQFGAKALAFKNDAAKHNFDTLFKSLLKQYENTAQVTTKKHQLKNKQTSYAALLFEQKQVERKLIMVRQLYGVKKVPLFYKGYLIRKLLLDRAVMNALVQVGLKPEHAYRYPHEFSGGQKQRINIARALILEPQLIIADEPIASLDVSIQAQIINLLIDLVKKRNISMIFIGHDLSIIKYLADSLCVMHLGKIVERGYADRVFAEPVHPYTQTLLAVIPKISNANEPFSAPKETREYLREYHDAPPRSQQVGPHHFVLANDAQVAKWWPHAEVKKSPQQPVAPTVATDAPAKVAAAKPAKALASTKSAAPKRAKAVKESAPKKAVAPKRAKAKVAPKPAATSRRAAPTKTIKKAPSRGPK